MSADPRPTIHTVAARAGVSKSLVSLVLRGSPKVSPDRRAAVQRAMAELGYRPNAAARDLRERRSRTVGALLNDMRHPWFVDLLDGLTDALAEQGRQLLLNSGRLDRRTRRHGARAFADLGVDGLVLGGTQAGSPTLAEVAEIVPTVAVGWRDLDLPRVDTVANDDLLGATLATRHLLELGHRRIAHIAGRVPGTRQHGRRRCAAAATRTRCARHGLAEHIRVESADYTDDGGYRATVRLLRCPEPPTAIFAVDDLICLGARSAAAEIGRRRAGRALARRLRQLLAGPAALDLAHQRGFRRRRGGAACGPRAGGPHRRPDPARAGAPARACAASARHHRRAPLTRTVRARTLQAGLKALKIVKGHPWPSSSAPTPPASTTVPSAKPSTCSRPTA